MSSTWKTPSKEVRQGVEKGKILSRRPSPVYWVYPTVGVPGGLGELKSRYQTSLHWVRARRRRRRIGRTPSPSEFGSHVHPPEAQASESQGRFSVAPAGPFGVGGAPRVRAAARLQSRAKQTLLGWAPRRSRSVRRVGPGRRGAGSVS